MSEAFKSHTCRLIRGEISNLGEALRSKDWELNDIKPKIASALDALNRLKLEEAKIEAAKRELQEKIRLLEEDHKTLCGMSSWDANIRLRQ